jgi:positive regulator of sigma E activity
MLAHVAYIAKHMILMVHAKLCQLLRLFKDLQAHGNFQGIFPGFLTIALYASHACIGEKVLPQVGTS